MKRHRVSSPQTFLNHVWLAVSLISFQLFLPVSHANEKEFIVHESGVFTQVTGSDGSIVRWSISTKELMDLPSFTSLNEEVTKQLRFIHFAPLRLNSKFTYFYNAKEKAVTYSMALPKGRVTSWYPAPFRPEADAKKGNKWFLDLLPPDSQKLQELLSTEDRGAYYSPAREVSDAWLVQSHKRGELPKGSREMEKFLFLTAVGHDPLPISLQYNLDDAIQIRNESPAEAKAVFLLHCQDGKLSWKKLALMPGYNGRDTPQQIVEKLPLEGVSGEDAAILLENELTQELITAGLFEAEAKALHNIWRNSWFQENGIRTLSVLPRSWVDHVLPTSMMPEADQFQRVFVGRNELISPAIEKEVLTMLKDTSEPALHTATFHRLNLGWLGDAVVERLITQEAFRMRVRYGNIEFLTGQKPGDEDKSPSLAPLDR